LHPKKNAQVAHIEEPLSRQQCPDQHVVSVFPSPSIPSLRCWFQRRDQQLKFLSISTHENFANLSPEQGQKEVREVLGFD